MVGLESVAAGGDKGDATNLEGRGAGSSTVFTDSVSGERILEVGCDESGVLLLSYHLYDEDGRVAADSDGFQHYPRGLTIASDAGEQLLDVPKDLSEPLRYRLYNSEGLLLTWSDGARTKIYPCLRMEGTAHGWTRPVATK